MTDDADTYTQAEVVRLLQRLDKTVTDLSGDIKSLENNYVTRAEWALFKESSDREIKQIRDAADSQKPPRVSGWAVAAVIVSALVGCGSLIVTFVTLSKAIIP